MSIVDILGKRSPIEIDAGLQEYLFPVVDREVGKNIIWANDDLVPRETHVEPRVYYRSFPEIWDMKRSEVWAVGSSIEASKLLEVEDLTNDPDFVWEIYYENLAGWLINKTREWEGLTSPNLPVCVFRVSEYRMLNVNNFDLVLKLFFQLSRLTAIDIPYLSQDPTTLEREIERHKAYRDAIAIALIAERSRREDVF